MANRRQVIGAGLALTVMPGAGKSLSLREPSGPAPIPVGRLVVDTHFPDAVEMAAQAATLGSIATALERDVLGLWHDDLLPAMRGSRLAAFGGITTDTTLFVVRTLAADQRMRVVYRSDHACPEGGVMRHVLAGSARTVSGIAGLAGAGDWRQQFGQAFGACHAAGRSMRRTVLTASEPADLRQTSLVSWVIVPLELL